ncbi:MAG: polyhydroxyalkanoate synthesis regulator DNA-binding domain-containing protein [Isosphaeraceae bacterium]
MIRIRRYPNRRFYDRTRRCYVTLGDIEKLVRDGGTVEVHDSRNGDDLTRQVLAQILLERYPDRMELFPTAFLHSLLQANGMALEFWGSYLRQTLELFESLSLGMPRSLTLPLPLPLPMAWPLAFLPGAQPAETMGARLAQLERRIGRLEGAQADDAPAADPPGDDAGTLARLEERVRGLEGMPRPRST